MGPVLPVGARLTRRAREEPPPGELARVYFDRSATQSPAKRGRSDGMHRPSSPHRENWAAWVLPPAVRSSKPPSRPRRVPEPPPRGRGAARGLDRPWALAVCERPAFQAFPGLHVSDAVSRPCGPQRRPVAAQVQTCGDPATRMSRNSGAPTSCCEDAVAPGRSPPDGARQRAPTGRIGPACGRHRAGARNPRR